MPRLDRRSMLAGGAAIAAGFAGTTGAAGARPPRRPQAPPGTWAALAPMPIAVQEIYPSGFWRRSAAPAGFKPRAMDILVSAGGIVSENGFSATGAVLIYDPQTDHWDFGAALPEARHHVALVAHQGALYAIGGFFADRSGGWQMRNTLWRIEDPDEGAWKALGELPSPQAESVAASLSGRIHVVGGRGPAGSRNLVWGDHIDTDRHLAYDARLDRWETRRPLPKPRNSAAGAVADGHLYLFGGRTVDGGVMADCDVYDPTSDRWQAIAPLPRPRDRSAPHGKSGHAAAVWNGKVYVMGGEWFSAGGSGVYADVYEYDPRADKWREVAPMPRPRHGLGAVGLEGGVYACGGASLPGASGVSNALDRFSF